jgi:fatty acid desaturase
MALAEAEAGAAEKRLEDIQNSGRTGVSPIAVAGGVVTAFTAFWSAWIVWWVAVRFWSFTCGGGRSF